MTFDKWWRELTLKGDPGRRPHLAEEAYAAGRESGIEEAAKVIDRYSLLKWRSDEIRALLKTEPTP